MVNIQEYFEQLSTAQLEQLVRDDLDGRQALPLDLLLLVCGILAQRDPPKKSAEEAFRDFLEHYLPKE